MTKTYYALYFKSTMTCVEAYLLLETESEVSEAEKMFLDYLYADCDEDTAWIRYVTGNKFLFDSDIMTYEVTEHDGIKTITLPNGTSYDFKLVTSYVDRF